MDPDTYLILMDPDPGGYAFLSWPGSLLEIRIRIIILEGCGARYVSHTNGSGSGWMSIFKKAWIPIGNPDPDHTSVLY